MIALEPTDDCHLTEQVIHPYLSATRFSLSINKSVLGWAENIKSLLEKVTTPYFVILLHDDLWSKNYLQSLFSALEHKRRMKH
jgi:hypothetical protein